MYRIKANKEIRVNAVSCMIPNFKTEHLFIGGTAQQEKCWSRDREFQIS